MLIALNLKIIIIHEVNNRKYSFILCLILVRENIRSFQNSLLLLLLLIAKLHFKNAYNYVNFKGNLHYLLN